MSRLAAFNDGAVFADPVNSGNTYISYYIYGQALALGIDLSIRTQFPGKSLDDWMRAMWRAHPDSGKPYTLEDLQQSLASVTSKDFAIGIFERHIYGKQPMPYAALLARAGLLLEKSPSPPIALGASMTFGETGARITGATLAGLPLNRAGLDRGDLILSWGGKALKTQAELDQWLGAQQPGSRVSIRVQTREGAKDLDLLLTPSPALRIVPYEAGGRALTAEMKEFRDSWLSAKAP